MKHVLLFNAKQNIFCILFWFFISAYSYASVSTVTVGTGTETGKHLPMECYYGYTYSQSIYKQSELDINGSYITSISYHFVNTSGSSSSFTDDIKIYLGHTTKSSFSSTSDWVSTDDMTLVYDGSIVVSGSDEWITIYLDTPFEYDNVNNLVVAFDENSEGYHSSSDEFYCHTTEEYSSIYYYSDGTNSDPSDPKVGQSVYAYRPNIQFGFDNYTCLAVSDIVITKNSVHEISVSWSLQDENQTDWIIEYGERGFTPGEGTQIATTSNTGTIISDLENGKYDLYVKADCGNDDYSGNYNVVAINIADFDGNGTSKSPFEISSLEDLQNFSQTSSVWDLYFILTTDIDASETETSDTYNNGGEGFSPIGNGDVLFTGSFDGNDHIISNLYINRSSAYNGLFGYVGSGASISNVGLESASITSENYNYVGSLVGKAVGEYGTLVNISNCFGNGGNVNGYTYVGGLVGYANYTSVTNSYSTNVVVGNGSYVGGFCGEVYYYDEFTYCYSSGQVTGGGYVGAFCGVSYSSTFTDCYFDKETSGYNKGGSNVNYDGLNQLSSEDFGTADNFSGWDFDSSSGVWQIGALNSDPFNRPRFIWQTLAENLCLTPISLSAAAVNNTSVTLSWTEMGTATSWTVEYGEHGFTYGEGTTVDVSGNTSTTITGLTYPAVYDFYVTSSCGSTSSVFVYANFTETGMGTEEDPYKISDLADLHVLSQTSSIWNSYYKMTADIDASETETSETYNNSGYGFSPIGNSTVTFTGSFDGNSHIISNLYINSNSNCVGMIGYAGSGATIKNLGLENATVKSYYTYSYYIGSIFGYLSGAESSYVTVDNCYSVGGDVEGYYYVGGFVGFSEYATYTNCYVSNSIEATGAYGAGFIGYNNYSNDFTNCYSSGKVTCSGKKGSFTAYVYGTTFTDCYYDKEISSCEFGGSGTDYDGLTGISTSDFTTADNFANWDFDSSTGMWQMGAIENDPYIRPRLMWQTLDTDVCLAPISVSLTVIDNTSIHIDWTEMGNATSWTVEYGEHGFTQGEGVSVDISDEEGIDITGLSYPMVYDFYVSSSCGTSASSIVYYNFSKTGLGTEENPYKISNLADLHMLSQYSDIWNKYFEQTANIDASETENSTTYNNNGLGFSPIGSSNVSFIGSYDGQGYVISNLYINSDSDYSGLFGIVNNGAVIKNLGLYGVSVSSYYGYGYYYGSLVGYINYGSENATIENCFSINGSVSAYKYVGGLIGYAYGVNVSDCYSDNTVSASYYAGGFTGRDYYYVNYENCYSAGSVDASSSVGGFVGYKYSASYTNCYFDTETSNQSYAINGADQDGISGLSTSNFSASDNFTDWDFSDTWVISKIFNQDVLRPRLQSQIRTLTLSVSGNGTTSPVAGTYNFSLGEPIEIEATASEDDSFLKWTLDGSDFSTESSFSVTGLDADVAIVASFTDETTDVDDNEFEEVSIYPNPANSYVWIKGDNIIDATISIHSVTGTTVYSQVADTNAGQIDISNLSPGSYYVVILKDNKTVYRQKLVVL